MKNTFYANAVAAIILMSGFSGCDKSENPPPATRPPAVEWASNPEFAVMEISDDMNIEIRITAEAGIRDFAVDVNSHAISPIISLLTSDGSSRMDLINDIQLIGMLSVFNIDLPAGDNLKDRTNVIFSLSSLVPMIADISGERDHDTNHIFTLFMTDNENRTVSKSLTFHYSYAE